MTDRGSEQTELEGWARRAPGPPLILGSRGCPRDAPENTGAGLRLALAVGLDGIAYDVRACATGEPALLRDAYLDATTDSHGLLRDLTLPQLFHVDAGAWFGKRFVGEPIPLLDEVLEFDAEGEQGKCPIHWIEVREREALEETIERVSELHNAAHVRLASPAREDCITISEAGLKAIWLPAAFGSEEWAFVRDERIAGLGGPSRLFSELYVDDSDPEGLAPPPQSELWATDVSDPRELLRLCRQGITGFSTDTPVRALSARALTRLAPEAREWPLSCPRLHVEAGGLTGEPVIQRLATSGEWAGSWRLVAHVRNPFPWPVEAAVGLRIRHGVFDSEGLPSSFSLEPLEERELPFELVGGSWSPGGDPLLQAVFRWGAGLAREAASILFEAPLERTRSVRIDTISRRLRMIRERPSEPEASMTVRRDGRFLLVSIENPGGLSEARTVVHLDGLLLRGGKGLRARLPLDFDHREGGVPFSCGVEGGTADRHSLRRWAGGLRGLGQRLGPDLGVPGRLLSAS